MRFIQTALTASALMLASAALGAPASAGWAGGSSGGACKAKDCGTPGSSGSSGATSSSTGGGSSGGMKIPEPADFGLFVAGVAGLVIGRRGFAKRRKNAAR